MLFLGLVIGVLLGAVAMHLKSARSTVGISKLQAELQEAHDKLKSVKSQLYKRRSSFRRKTNAQANAKKAVKKTTRKKTTANTKSSNI
jgi:uncharacterized membrane-anchored protein YhcB (DUF1043 family)